MADGSYYYALYKRKRDDVRAYESDSRDLSRVLSNLTDTMGDEIRAVNLELEDLKSDLSKSIRHNSGFSSSVSLATSEKEKVVTADPLLSVAVQELQEEIYRLSELKNAAINEREYYYGKYMTKKEEERKKFWDNIF